MNNRKMQAYSAICLLECCRQKSIIDPELNNLILYLLSILKATDLTIWDQEICDVDIPGRGEELPDRVMVKIKNEEQPIFVELINNCTEIGIADMYGANTNAPEHHYLESLNNCKQLGVELPRIDPILEIENGNNPWGNAISSAEYKNILDYYGL